jgi:hypothetical protein
MLKTQPSAVTTPPYKPAVLMATQGVPSAARAKREDHLVQNANTEMVGFAPFNQDKGIPDPSLTSSPALCQSLSICRCSSALNLQATALAVMPARLPMLLLLPVVLLTALLS